MYYRGASAAIVVFDITHASSFQRAKKWIVELRQNVNNPNLIIALVGNKADLVDERTIPEDEASSYAQELDLLYFETSAKENINVEELFNTIAEKCVFVYPFHPIINTVMKFIYSLQDTKGFVSSSSKSRCPAPSSISSQACTTFVMLLGQSFCSFLLFSKMY